MSRYVGYTWRHHTAFSFSEVQDIPWFIVSVLTNAWVSRLWTPPHLIWEMTGMKNNPLPLLRGHTQAWVTQPGGIFFLREMEWAAAKQRKLEAVTCSKAEDAESPKFSEAFFHWHPGPSVSCHGNFNVLEISALACLKHLQQFHSFMYTLLEILLPAISPPKLEVSVPNDTDLLPTLVMGNCFC